LWDWAAIHRWCLSVARRYAAPDDSEDIAQEALVRAFRSRDRCATPERPWAWLSVITQREATRAHERRRLIGLGGEPEELGAPDPRLEALPEQDLVRRAVAGLDARDRAIVLLHYEHDMTVAAIARTIGVPVGTVKVKLHRIRGKLRGHLTP
jgi:RNA polymerase sigma-70 factor (ECF subfamily)